MRAFVEILTGPQACRRVPLPPGSAVRIGRHEEAEVALPNDAQLSGLHFALEFDGAACRLRDLGSAKGTELEGDRVERGEVRDGDTIIAGETWFRVRVRPPRGADLELGEADRRLPEALVRAALVELRAPATPLFALLDAARDPGVLALLRDGEAPYQSLYEGMAGQVMSEEAPYLVALGHDAWLDEALVRRGWGRSWGIFAQSREGFRDLRRHFRQFLLVNDEADRELYFRFYDPRVLRVFLPTCKPKQLHALFAAVEAFAMEGEAPSELLRFTMDAGRMKRQVAAL